MNHIRTTWHHIRRSPFQSLIAIIVMTLSFFVMSIFIFTNTGLSTVLNYFETKPEITLFLKDGLDKTTIEGIQKELSNYKNVKEIKYISKDKALEIYKEQNKENPLLTEMVTASILPASFEVTVSEPATLEEIYQNYSTRTTIIDEIIYQKDVIKSLLNWTKNIRITGILITTVIGSISLLTIITIIGMKITNRKEEIKISRLLGASKFYVKKPFLLEGLFYGIFGSFFGFIFTFIIILIIRKSVNSFFQPVVFFNISPIFYLEILLIELLVGSILGLFASWIGSNRYIKY